MYDARGGGNSSDNNTVFGIAIIGVVIAAFAAVFLWPTGKNPKPVSIVESTAPVSVSASFANKQERAIALTIADIDSDAYKRFETRLTAGEFTTARRDEIILEEVSAIVMANIDIISQADVKHFDAILSDIRQGLQTAGRSDAKLCKGATYSELEGMSPRKLQAFMEKELMDNEGVRNFGLKLTGRILDAIADAKVNPVKHGPMDASDDRAVQGLAMSLVTQPEIMMLAMAANSGNGAEAALAKIDICHLSVAALKAVDTLPDRTKGRLWAQGFAEIQKGGLNFDPAAMAALRGF